MGYVEDAEKVFKDWYSTRDKNNNFKNKRIIIRNV